jgi:hypothetical protein
VLELFYASEPRAFWDAVGDGGFGVRLEWRPNFYYRIDGARTDLNIIVWRVELGYTAFNHKGLFCLQPAVGDRAWLKQYAKRKMLFCIESNRKKKDAPAPPQGM